jgi:hypothetical protein
MEIANTEVRTLKFGSAISAIYQPGAGFLNLRIWISLMMTMIEMLLQRRKCTFWLKERRIWRPLLLLSAPFTPSQTGVSFRIPACRWPKFGSQFYRAWLPFSLLTLVFRADLME